jgi:hypothetical protein
MSDDTKSGKPDAGGKPPPADAGKATTLDELRSRYEAAVSEAAKGAPDKSNPELKALRDEVEKLRTAEADRTYRKEMDSFIVPAVAGETGVDPDLVEMWVNKHAASDPALMALWNERAEKPKEFKAAIEALKPDFQKYAESKGLAAAKKDQPDKGGKKLESAVRSARVTDAGKAHDFSNVNLGAMSDTQFAMHAAEVYRAARAGQLT